MNDQLDLFPCENPTQPVHDGPLERIGALTYVPGYVSTEEQHDLLQAIDAAPWLEDLRRRVQHYGFRYDYKAWTPANC